MITETEKAPASLSLEFSRKLALWEICSVVASGLIAEWVVFAFAGRSKVVAAIPVLLALGFMLFSHRERSETLRDLGFRADNFIAAARLLVVPTLLVVVLVVVRVWFTGPLSVAPWRNRFVLLPLWALFQQYVLNGFLNRRAQLALGQGWKSVLLVAVIFALFHLPNAGLTALTFAGGLLWASVYQRKPNLFALALSHALASITLALTISPNLLNGLRVGFKYFGSLVKFPGF